MAEQKEAIVALLLSTSEAEYVSVTAATQEAVYIAQEATCGYSNSSRRTVIIEDNQGAIGTAKNPIQHAQTKHINIRYHYVCEALEKGVISLSYCPRQDVAS